MTTRKTSKNKRPARRNGNAPSGLLYLRHVPLDRGGYTSSGRYFGVGERLYEYFDADYNVAGYVRAYDRESAKRAVRREVPGAKFMR